MRYAAFSLCAAHWTSAPAATCAEAPSQAELSWRAPEECPTQQHAREVLAGLIGPHSAPLATSLVQIDITHSAQSYAAKIVFSGDLRGDRELHGDDCETLTNAALLITALTLDPLAAADKITEARRERPRETRGVRLHIGMHMAADLGTLPNATVGPAIEAGVELDRLLLVAQGTWWVPQLELLEDRGGRMSLVEAGLRGCWELMRLPSVGAGPCAAVSAGSYWASGERLMRGEESYAPWAATRIGVRLRQNSENVFLDASIELGLTVVSPRYSVDEDPFFQPRWFGRVALGFGWRL